MENKVFLGGISRDADESATNEFVKKFGNPREIINTGKGYSFVKFDTADEMQIFVDKINGEELCGQRVRADISKPKERPAGNGCFKCGQEGHMSRDCPQSGGGGRPAGNGCFNCGEEGHMSRDCPKPKKGSECFKCGEGGHRAADCTGPAKKKEEPKRSPPRRRDSRSRSPPRRRKDSRSPPRKERRDSRSPKRRKDSRSPPKRRRSRS